MRCNQESLLLAQLVGPAAGRAACLPTVGYPEAMGPRAWVAAGGSQRPGSLPSVLPELPEGYECGGFVRMW